MAAEILQAFLRDEEMGGGPWLNRLRQRAVCIKQAALFSV